MKQSEAIQEMINELTPAERNRVHEIVEKINEMIKSDQGPALMAVAFVGATLSELE